MDLFGVHLLPLLTVLAGSLALSGALVAVLEWLSGEPDPRRRVPPLQRLAVRGVPLEANSSPANALRQAPRRDPPFLLRRCTRADRLVSRGPSRALTRNC